MAQVKRRSWRLFKKHLHIDFINQHPSIYLARYLSNFGEGLVVCQNAAGIVEIGDHNQSRAIADPFLNLRWHQAKAISKPAIKSFHVGAQVVGQRQKRFVSRTLKEHFVTGIDQSSHRQMVCECGAGGCDNAIRVNSMPRSESLNQRFVTVAGDSSSRCEASS